MTTDPHAATYPPVRALGVRWLRAWALLFVLVQVWHACAVFALPASAPGGSLAWLGAPFHPYMRVFSSYRGAPDDFLVATTLLDLVEVCLAAVGLALLSTACRRGGLVFLGSSQILYAYKLVVVVALEWAGGWSHVTADGARFITAYLLPNLLMLGLTASAAVACGRRLLHHRPS